MVQLPQELVGKAHRGTAEKSKSLPRGKGFRDGVTWKDGHSPAQKKRTCDGSLFCAGYGSLPKNTKREFKLFPFFQKASKYLRKISDRKQISRFGKFTVVFGMICTSHVPRTRIPHCKRDMQRYKFPFAKMYL